MHAPRSYQAVELEERRDVIEYPIVDDIDLNGWDVRKTLRLFWKSNPAFVEWIQSPIIYMERGVFRRDALMLLPEVYSPEKGVYHHLSMPKTNYRGHLRESTVRLKKYFYVLRPLLAALGGKDRRRRAHRIRHAVVVAGPRARRSREDRCVVCAEARRPSSGVHPPCQR